MAGGPHYSILRGSDAVVDQFFGVTDPNLSARYGTRAVYLHRDLQRQVAEAATLLAQLHAVVAANWSGRVYRKPPSSKNWRCEGTTHYDICRKGKEVILEREIVKAFPGEWINNVPTTSGTCGPSHDKARNVDLVHLAGPDEIGLYELKWDADTPIFAAIEIILRGVLYIFSRQNAAALGYAGRDLRLLRATAVRLGVLAPSDYYHDDLVDLAWLERALDAGIRQHAAASVPGLAMSFGFEMFPPPLAWPLCGDPLRVAVQSRQPAYPMAPAPA